MGLERSGTLSWFCFICVNSNAHHELWGDWRTDTRGEALLEIVELLQLATLNDGSETFIRAGVSNGVLDLTFASPEIRTHRTRLVG